MSLYGCEGSKGLALLCLNYFIYLLPALILIGIFIEFKYIYTIPYPTLRKDFSLSKLGLVLTSICTGHVIFNNVLCNATCQELLIIIGDKINYAHSEVLKFITAMYTLLSERYPPTLSGFIPGGIEGGSSTPGPSNPQPGSNNILPDNSDSHEQEDNVNLPVVNTLVGTPVYTRVYSTTNQFYNHIMPVSLLQPRPDIKFKFVPNLNLLVLLPIQGNIALDNSSNYYISGRLSSTRSDVQAEQLFRSLSQYHPVPVQVRGAKLGFYHKFLYNSQISLISPLYR